MVYLLLKHGIHTQISRISKRFNDFPVFRISPYTSSAIPDSQPHYLDYEPGSVINVPCDHEKKNQKPISESTLIDGDISNRSILDTPSDHEKRQDVPPVKIDYTDYELGIESRVLLNTSGVFRKSESEDIKLLVNNFTAPALAAALRERESILQVAAKMALEGDINGLNDLLLPFQRSSVERKRKIRHGFDFSLGFTRRELVLLQRYIHRMPRQVAPAIAKRASVVLPLCNDRGVASVLFERRAGMMRSYPNQVCFPGGMLDEGVDNSIIQTSLRELEEELGVPLEKAEVLGVMRCNWQEVASFTGIAVTPVIGYLGELTQLNMKPNRDEVQDLFTISLADLLDESKWILKDRAAPIYTGGPYVIFGLTAYFLRKFLEEVVHKCRAYSIDAEEPA